MSAKRKQPEIKFSSFTPPQRGPAASAILGIQLSKEDEKDIQQVTEATKEQTIEEKSEELKSQKIEDKLIEKLHHEEELVKETDLEKPETKKSASVEMLISGLKKDSFVSRHQKESFYIENDLHETFFDVTSGTKSAKTTLINLALKEFFENHNVEIKKYTGQYATGTRRKKKNKDTV